jgi:hypothetical protein
VLEIFLSMKCNTTPAKASTSPMLYAQKCLPQKCLPLSTEKGNGLHTQHAIYAQEQL